MGTKKTDNLIENLSNQDFDERNKAIDALTSIGTKEVIDVLLSLLKKDSPRIVKEGACKALGKIRAPKATKLLIKALNDEDESVRYQAAIALGRIGDVKAVNPLMEIVRNRDDPLVRSEAAKALGMIGDPSALKILMNILKTEEDRFIRYHAVTSLGKIGDTRAKRTLEKIAEEAKDERLHRRALEAIEKIEEVNKKQIVAG